MAEWEMAFEKLAGEMRIGFGQVVSAIQQTNEQLVQTNLRLDQTNDHLKEFKLSVNSKLDGIGSYLKLIDRNFVGVEMRLTKIEHRVDKLEDVG
jgi:uncharacterized coiled-coil protein SlyX